MNCAPCCATRRSAPSRSAARAYEKLCTGRHLAKRQDDIGIGTATAQIAAQALADRRLRQGFGGLRAAAILREERHCRTDLTGCTEPALESVIPQKGGLHGMQAAVLAGEVLDGDDVIVPMHDREGHRRIDSP